MLQHSIVMAISSVRPSARLSVTRRWSTINESS